MSESSKPFMQLHASVDGVTFTQLTGLFRTDKPGGKGFNIGGKVKETNERVFFNSPWAEKGLPAKIVFSAQQPDGSYSKVEIELEEKPSKKWADSKYYEGKDGNGTIYVVSYTEPPKPKGGPRTVGADSF